MSWVDDTPDMDWREQLIDLLNTSDEDLEDVWK